MGILLKVLLCLVLLAVLAVVVVLGSYFIAIVAHEWRWRNVTTDEYRQRHEQSKSDR